MDIHHRESEIYFVKEDTERSQSFATSYAREPDVLPILISHYLII